MKLLETRREDGRNAYELTEDEIRAIIGETAKEAARAALNEVQADFFKNIGKTLFEKLLVILAALAFGAYLWLTRKPD